MQTHLRTQNKKACFIRFWTVRINDTVGPEKAKAGWML